MWWRAVTDCGAAGPGAALPFHTVIPHRHWLPSLGLRAVVLLPSVPVPAERTAWSAVARRHPTPAEAASALSLSAAVAVREGDILCWDGATWHAKGERGHERRGHLRDCAQINVRRPVYILSDYL